MVVSRDTIRGVSDGFFDLGIVVGNRVWGLLTPDPCHRPATITDNKFIGNIRFSMVVNG